MPYAKRNTKNSAKQKGKMTKILIPCSIITAIALIFLVSKSVFRRNEYAQLNSLRAHVFKDDAIRSAVEERRAQSSVNSDIYAVFLSVCDSTERARVFTGTGKGLEAAWNDAERLAVAFMTKNDYNLLWVKADIVDSSELVEKTRMNNYTEETVFQNFFRKGIAFDPNFKVAFLEAEISGNKLLKYYTEREVAAHLIDYQADLFDLRNINFYLSRWRDAGQIEEVPDEIIVFTTVGFFCDENNEVFKLYNDGMYTGRRVAEETDDLYFTAVVQNASQYLYDLIKEDGAFEYGYFPVFDNWMTNYNILRHASSLWSLINLYRMTNNDAIIDGIDRGMDYLLGEIEYMDEETAYLIERKSGEVKLGGNGLAIIAMTEYMEVFNSKKYKDVVEHLANGILHLQDPNDGTFYHVLHYPGYTRKEAYRIVYYDGEATFALVRAYTFTGLDKFLDGARISVENFIINDFTQYRDHWVAYSLYEITKYLPEPRYFEFALRNVENNIDRIYNQTTSYHTYLELLAISWQTYAQLVESGIEVEYLDGFDVEYFAETLYKRANYMLNSFFFPEYAMYMRVPENVLGTFFTRHDSFRIRIDDIQHFIGGYYYFIENYESIRHHLSDEFISRINAGEINPAAVSDSEDTYEEE